MVFYSFYSINMKSCSLISLGGNSKESLCQSQRVLLKMAPSTRVCNIFLPRWFRHFTKAAEEQEAKATRNRADPFWLVGLLLASGSWWLKIQFLMGPGGWASKAEDQNSLVGLSWYLKRKKPNKTNEGCFTEFIDHPYRIIPNQEGSSSLYCAYNVQPVTIFAQCGLEKPTG